MYYIGDINLATWHFELHFMYYIRHHKSDSVYIALALCMSDTCEYVTVLIFIEAFSRCASHHKVDAGLIVATHPNWPLITSHVSKPHFSSLYMCQIVNQLEGSFLWSMSPASLSDATSVEASTYVGRIGSARFLFVSHWFKKKNLGLLHLVTTQN